MNPFFMENTRIAGLPSIPLLSNFIAVNVRTYVYNEEGIPGIWFYSLDVNSLVASNTARMTYSLPYFYADLKQIPSKTGFNIKGKREKKPTANINFIYEPTEGISHEAKTGTLEFFLLERYVLYSISGNQIYSGRVHHFPYPICKQKRLNVTLLY